MTQDGALDAEVVGDHVERRVRVADGVDEVGGDGGGQVDAVRRRRVGGRRSHRGFVGAERAGHRARVAEVPGEPACRCR